MPLTQPPSDPARSLLTPGTVRRIRRTADLSQRELAAELGVSQTTVARWETGKAAPDLETLARMAALAGLRVALVDTLGGPVAPMAEHAVRDGAGRRFPAHLDGWDCGPIPRRFLHRGVYRDLFRRLEGTPPDHPAEG